MLQLIKKPDGLRAGNLILVDSFAFPPNFICAKPMGLGEDFESLLNEKTDNCAFLNLEEMLIKQLLPDEKEDMFWKDGFSAKKVHDASFDKFPKWKIKFKKTTTEISFMHELQNFYKDWTGSELF